MFLVARGNPHPRLFMTALIVTNRKIAVGINASKLYLALFPP